MAKDASITAYMYDNYFDDYEYFIRPEMIRM
jgi:hypothetical protein